MIYGARMIIQPYKHKSVLAGFVFFLNKALVNILVKPRPAKEAKELLNNAAFDSGVWKKNRNPFLDVFLWELVTQLNVK